MGLDSRAGDHRRGRREPHASRRATSPTCWSSSRASRRSDVAGALTSKVLMTPRPRSTARGDARHERQRNDIRRSRLMQVLLAPDRLREGTAGRREAQPVCCSRSLRDATKPEIKAAVELMFKVQGRSDRGHVDDQSTARPSASAAPWAVAPTGRRPYVTRQAGPGDQLPGAAA
jgi:hypothetical protein